jgi:uncharacterized SAM-binding protein YcdF (DUF218 family)
MRNRKRTLRWAVVAFFAAAFAAAAARLALSAVAWWIDSSDQPVKSDVIVVLAGDYSRPAFAAELYAQGFAPEVWISRPRRISALVKLDALGIHLPLEESINRDILVKRGVPADRIRLYARDAVSTADEAEALGRECPAAGKKILVVTSRFHARRSRMIFRRLLPKAEIRVVAAPEAGYREWWKDKELAERAVMEPLKALFFLAGGRMRR